MAQSMRPISTVTDGGNFTGATAHGSVDGTAPDTGDYWNGNDNQDDVLEVLLTDLSATTPAAGTCTVSIYETDSDTDSAPAGSSGTAPTYDIEVYEGATQRAARTGITPTSGTFTLDNALTFAAADITDWSDVRARFTSYGTGGNPANRRGAAVSFIEISTPDASSDYELTTNAPQALTLTEQTATLTHDVNITTTAPQALVVATYTADITVPVNVDVTTTDPQALTLTEQTATVTHDVSITTTAPQALSVTEQTSTITHDVNITTEAPQALSITPQTATVSYGVNIEANAPQALTLTEQTATLAHDVNITTGSPQALGITPQTATLTHDVNVTTTAPQALSLTEQTATVTHDVSITTTAPQALSLTEQTATLTHDVSITTGAPQALSVTTYTAGVAFGSVDVEVTTTAPQVLSLATYPATVAAVSPLAVPGSTFTTFAITNTGASADSGNKYNVCSLTGFKQVRDSLSTTWNGVKVRPESYDIKHPQLSVSVKAEELSGPVRPEAADVFVSTSTAPSDL